MTLTGRIDNTDIPDPGTSDGKAQVMTLRCTVCDWNISSTSAFAFTASQNHVDDTGHEISYRGVVQACFRPSHLPKEN